MKIRLKKKYVTFSIRPLITVSPGLFSVVNSKRVVYRFFFFLLWHALVYLD